MAVIFSVLGLETRAVQANVPVGQLFNELHEPGDNCVKLQGEHGSAGNLRPNAYSVRLHLGSDVLNERLARGENPLVHCVGRGFSNSLKISTRRNAPYQGQTCCQ